VWTVPEGRMKGEREHRVALPKAAVAVLRELFDTTPGDLVFPGLKPGRPISEATMTKAMKTAGGVGATVHGFRSSFKDWATEETNFAGEISEAALSHLVGDETERAYKRGDVLAKRRRLMEAWANFCLTPPKTNVISIGKHRQAV
jgi:integrase